MRSEKLKTVYSINFETKNHAVLLTDRLEVTPLGPLDIAGPTLYSLVSAGTELNLYVGNYEAQGHSWGRFPIVPGYAAVFKAEELGSSVTDIERGQLLFSMGSHQSWQRHSRELVIRLPDGVVPEWALFARMANIGMSVLTTTARRPPQRVVVIGLGVVGLLASMIFSRCGYSVIAIDSVPERREIARRKGIAQVLSDIDAGSIGKVPLVIDCTGHEAAILSGVRLVEPGGEVVVAGVPMVRMTEIFAQELLDAVFRSHATLRSGKEQQVSLHPTPYREGSQFGNMVGVLDWIARGTLDVGDLYYLASPADAQRVYQDTLHKQGPALVPIFDWAAMGLEPGST